MLKELQRHLLNIDAEGLRDALDSLARGVGPNIACRCEHTGDVSIVDNKMASHLFRIAQESLNNAIRHGLTSGAIANPLHLSRHAIDTHRENIKRKLGARDAGELNRQAVQWLLENG